MNYLSIPLKKTYDINLVEPLQAFITAQYKSDDKNPFSEEGTEAVNEFNKLRYKAVIQPLDKHDSSLEVLYRYYDQLAAVDAKLPLTPTQIPINFKWKDAFDKGSLFFGKAALSLTYGSFERACVLFNIAALQSQVAAAQPLTTDEELKCAAKLFQQSAGALTHLKEHVLSWVPQEPTMDMSPDTLQALSTLMIAQAQDAIYLKAAKDKMKPALLVKVSAQTAEMYAEANRQMSRDVVKALWEREWLSIVTGKQLAFTALAHFHKAQECNAKKEIGEELARLTEATAQMNKARAYFPPNTFQTEQAQIQRAFDVAKKDNDFIYHERIPTLNSLAPLEKAVLAKPTAVAQPLSQRFKDLFSALVPVAVSQALAAYDVRRTEIVNMEIGRLREHTQLLNGILTSLNLPAALDDVTNAQTLPESLRHKSAKVKADGGLQELERMINELPILQKRNKEILDETSRVLAEERSSDDALRAQFKEKWTRMASEKLTDPLWAEVGKYKGILETAANADAVVRQKFGKSREAIELLSRPEPDLKAAIPVIGASHATNTSGVVSEMRALMTEVEEIRKQRDTMESQMKDVKFDMSQTFLKAMGESGVLDERALSEAKLNEIYAPLRQAVSASVARQEELVGKIQETNNRFSSAGNNSDTARERERVLKMLATGHDAFVELRSNLNEGTKFYNDLTPLLLRLQQKASDFCFARKTEKEDLMKDLQQNIISGGNSGNSSTSNVPPPRPPPPSVPQTSAPQYSAPMQAAAPVNTMPYQGMTYPVQQNPAMPYPSAAAMPPVGYGQQQAPYPMQPQQQAYGQPPPYAYQPQQPYAYQTYPGAQQQQQQPYPGYPPTQPMPYPVYGQPMAPPPQPGAPSPWHQQPGQQ